MKLLMHEFEYRDREEWLALMESREHFVSLYFEDELAGYDVVGLSDDEYDNVWKSMASIEKLAPLAGGGLNASYLIWYGDDESLERAKS